MKIIIVDDSAHIRNCIHDLLAGHKDLILAGEATNIHDGLRLISEAKPDCVVIDLVMPGGNGLVLLGSVKAILPGCKIIILTNHVDEQIRSEAWHQGADHFLDKAFEFEKLIDAIRT